MNNKIITGHVAALFTLIVWGTTYISTKVLLKDFQPVEILLFRFVMGLIALFIAYPHPLKWTTKKQEATFALAGLSGLTMYYLLENVALTYTSASNVGVIISVAPFFTAVLSGIFLKEEKPSWSFYLGFVVAMGGICIISFNGAELNLNPMGDFLALVAAFVWALYAVLSKKIAGYGYNIIQSTRRIFTYGIIFMLPCLFFFDFKLDLSRFSNGVNLLNMLYLGICASAVCFVTWNFAVKVLGAVKTSVYIYASPVITVVMSVIILKERVNALSATGIALTLAGLLLSDVKMFMKKRVSHEEV